MESPFRDGLLKGKVSRSACMHNLAFRDRRSLTSCSFPEPLSAWRHPLCGLPHINSRASSASTRPRRSRSSPAAHLASAMRSHASWVRRADLLICLRSAPPSVPSTPASACDALQSSPPLVVNTVSRGALAGLHGAAVSIMGRREAVVKESSEALEAEHIRCLGVQVSERGTILSPRPELPAAGH